MEFDVEEVKMMPAKIKYEQVAVLREKLERAEAVFQIFTIAILMVMVNQTSSE